MAEHIYPPSYLCDCGYQCDFCENTVREMKALSLKRNKRQHLVADDGRHEVVFHKGKWVDLVCPKAETSKTDNLQTREYLEERAKRGRRKKFVTALSKVRDAEPHPNDRLNS